ncbi:ATP-binding protein [Amphibacillus indicireducens]|uniref:ATP-binding protein n=1 Tax=Amphibacillus indicireducens TaxID=1076330 RepID=UPI0031EC1770
MTVYSQRKIEYYHVKQDQIRLTIDRQLPSYRLANLPEPIINWIEHHGFDFFGVVSSKGEIEYVSSSIEKVLGYLPNQIIGDSFLNYIPRHLHKNFIDTFQLDIYFRQRFTIQLKSIREKHVWVDLIIKPIYVEDTNTVMYLFLVDNMTDKKEAEEILIRSEKMSVAGQLAAGVVHEIRNPLTSLKGFIDLLQAGLDRKEEYFNIMIEEIDKIEKVSTELLYISRPLTHDHVYQWLMKMIEDVIVLLNTQAVKKNIKLVLDCPEDVVVYADRSQMKQVFINLIKNAIEAMTESGEILIKVEKQGDFCLISVIDEGPGIPINLIHQVKEPFFTTKKEGTGLGLMITTRIIENHNGLFKIKPNNDKGTTFEIKLPHYDPAKLTQE